MLEEGVSLIQPSGVLKRRSPCEACPEDGWEFFETTVGGVEHAALKTITDSTTAALRGLKQDIKTSLYRSIKETEHVAPLLSREQQTLCRASVRNATAEACRMQDRTTSDPIHR